MLDFQENNFNPLATMATTAEDAGSFYGPMIMPFVFEWALRHHSNEIMFQAHTLFSSCPPFPGNETDHPPPALHFLGMKLTVPPTVFQLKLTVPLTVKGTIDQETRGETSVISFPEWMPFLQTGCFTET